MGKIVLVFFSKKE